MRTIEWKQGIVITIDQTKLPYKEELLRMRDCSQVASGIRQMKMRGAPLIGVAAAYGLALTAYHSDAESREQLMKELEESAELLRESRPTAVNLFWGVDQVLETARETAGEVGDLAQAVVDKAQKMADEDVAVNRRIGEHGAKLIQDGDVVLTHCNAGSLATVDYGTALGVIRAAREEGKKVNVITTETRPRLQGARLTTYELKRDAIPVTLITDNMVGYAMSNHLVNKVVVGADRIVQDGVINKIGTYVIAVLARVHDIPFYVAAPKSTCDLDRKSEEAAIEERSPEEVTHFGGQRTTPKGICVLNPAFDITPMKYVKAIVCEDGALSPSEVENST